LLIDFFRVIGVYLKKYELIGLTKSAGEITLIHFFSEFFRKSGNGKANCQRNEKNGRWNFIFAKSGLFNILFSLLSFNLSVIIILKIESRDY